MCPPPFACHLNTSFSVPKRTGGGHRPTPDRWRRSYTTESIVCVFSTRRTSEEHKAAGISELRPPDGDAEKRLMDIECRWNVYDIVLCKRIGLTDYDGNPDWGQFEKFLETLKRRPFAEKELNAERMGTQVRKAAGIPTALVPHVWRCGQNSDPFDPTQLTGAVFPAVLSEATPYATVTMGRCSVSLLATAIAGRPQSRRQSTTIFMAPGGRIGCRLACGYVRSTLCCYAPRAFRGGAISAGWRRKS